jgi:predicted flap endonuclease-1-like 5' DNA nuclease
MQWLFDMWWVLAAFLLGWVSCYGFFRWTRELEPVIKLPLLRQLPSDPSSLNAETKLAQFPEVDTAAALRAGFVLRDKTDLEVIEGVGPKICALLHESGYPTLEALSKATIHDLYKILHDASPNYKFVKPDTWAQQAQLAAQNKWYELKGLQDYLTLGMSAQTRELNTF